MRKIILCLATATAITAIEAQPSYHHRHRQGADNHHLTFYQLPASAQTFVNTYFDRSDIKTIDRGRQGGHTNYNVRFRDNSRIKFSADGTWEKVHLSRYDVPRRLVPPRISYYVNQTYPGEVLMTVERRGRHWIVELSDGMKLKFDSSGNLKKVIDRF
ncbi:MAG: PepSY-like domain-containing protein [Tidjanibacter sp.]|nr:PepSY-like domain-containing protein [Tidjanibacter sp.]MBR7102571.1 PepSY-like domain-containing protein [Tidjanibacter sp.]